MDSGNRDSGTLSRRVLMGAGAASLLLPAFGEPLPGAPAPQPLATETSGANLLTIDVRLDGKGPFRFVIDTGADRSVISDAVARELGIRAGTKIMVEGVVRSVETEAAHIGTLTVGPITRNDLELPILPREQLMADGYLGIDVVNGYRVQLDFLHGQLYLLEPHSGMTVGWDAPREVPVRVVGNNGHLRAFHCEIDGVRSTAFVDTGAEISVGNALLFKMLAERSAYPIEETIPLTGVTGGVINGNVVTVRRIELGGMTIEQSRIAVADLQIFKLWEIDDKPSLLIGMNWLRRFNRVSIDYGRKQIRFDLASLKPHDAPLRCVPGTARCSYSLG